jgi:protein-L-isoaspartate(D-aspartate) O-methyltransferase
MLTDKKRARERMVEEQLVSRGIGDTRVLEAMRKVPRHRFVPVDMQASAYEDRPLQIGHDQTISQPYMVAVMTEALELTGSEKTLEIGTGSGYQAALLAELSRHVYTVERLKELQDRARRILDALGYTNISYHVANGTLGWEEHRPYDAVMVTAGAPRVPPPLVEQLADGGRLLVPVGDRLGQVLTRLRKKGGRLEREHLGGCRFVALLGEEGW